MGTIVELEQQESSDPGRIMQAMRVARLAAGHDLESWARRLGILVAAVEAYENGINVPCADTFLLAMTLGGLQLDRDIGRWVRQMTHRHVQDVVAPLPIRH